MISYAYERVSSKDQHLDRQDFAIKSLRPNIPEENIFTDKLTGKNFERNGYQALKVILEHISKVKGSEEIIEVIFEEIDRLGRNAEGIKAELQWFKEHGICVRILEIPTTLIEISEENRWVTDLITQILIEVYAAVAEQELEKRAKRQREGIDEAHKKGVQFGRKPIWVNQDKFEFIYKKWKSGAITARQAMQELGIKPNTFYRRVKDYEDSLSNNMEDKS